MRQANQGSPASHSVARSNLDALWLFIGLCLLYVANGNLVILADSVSNSYLPLSVINEGNLSITPDECPFLFEWELRTPRGTTPLGITEITSEVAALRTAGLIRSGRENYNVVPSTRPGSLYVSQFGPGAGLTAVPAVAIVQMVAGDLMNNRRLLAAVCRAVAAACVAGSAALVYLTARQFVSRGASWLLALAYGLGTCVWTTSSQSLVQQGPNALYLALGSYALARGIHQAGWLAVSGLAYGAAVVCRPTSGVVVLAVGGYLLATNRRGCLAYALGSLPPLLFLAGYNFYYFGNPFTFGQTVQAAAYLKRETGSTNAWTTPLFTGLAGLLISPSRGLLVYSPWLVFSFVGAIAVWRRAEYAWLRPLTMAIVAIALVQAKWFSWWGGWSYGPRPLADTMSMGALLVLPTIGWVARYRTAQAVLAVLLLWSVFVQALGAVAYDMDGWNARRGFAVQAANGDQVAFAVSRSRAAEIAELSRARVVPAVLNIDFPPHTDRLWSLGDNQIGYYLTHFGDAREARRRAAREGNWITGRNPKLTHYNLGVAFAELGRLDEAAAQYRDAIAASPDFVAAYLNLGNIAAQRRQFDKAEAIYRDAIRLAPGLIDPRENLGRVLADQGKFGEAIEKYRECLKLEPDSARTYYLIAEALVAQGTDAAAAESLQEATRIEPWWIEPRRLLAWVLATSGDARVRNPRAAWGIARELISATRSRDVRVLETAAVAAAAAGRFDEAIRLLEAALNQPSIANNEEAATNLRTRQEAFRRGEAYIRPRAPAAE